MFNNIPVGSDRNPSATAFSTMYEKPLALETNTFNLMKGFFEARGFDKLSADTVAVTFIKQATRDGYNPLAVLDTLKTMDGLKLNAAVTEILNYNRYKTSYLGSNKTNTAFEPVARNIVA